MQSQASSLLQTLPGLAMQETLRTSALVLAAKLKDTSQRVMFELALLQTELGEGKADAAAVVWRLSGLDAAMMGAVASLAEVVDALEKAAERDEEQEPAFVLLIETVGTLLKELQNAKKATGALEAILPRRPRAPAAGGAGLSGQ
jgi:ABC-type transporter Mla subunit MlaD